MVIAIDTVALRAAREQLWYGLATIETTQQVKDPITKVTRNEKVMLYENIPCKLSHRQIQYNEQERTGPGVIRHATKVSIGNELTIPPGCTFIITQSGKTNRYKQSGKSGDFIVHQEVPLVLEQDYA